MSDRYLYRAKTRLIVGTYNFGKEDGEWVKGYLYCDTGRWMIKQFEFDRANYIDYEVDPSTICQCTGLKDKNGKLIFENDIVYGKMYLDHGQWGESVDDKEIIKWRDDLTKFDPCSYMKLDKYEIIGNIFDNPELLEVGE